MSNLDALLEGNDSASTVLKPCVIGRHIQGLPEPYNAAVRSMLSNPDLSADLVAYRLKSAGLKGSNRTVLIHRRGICGCPSEVYGE